MPIAIDATVGGASANSFVTLAEAQAYMDGRLNSTAWDSASTDSKNRALVEATRELSALLYVGQRGTSTQVLSWPRWGAINPDSPFGFLYDANIIPDRVKSATEELAFQFLNLGTTDAAGLDPNFGVIEKTIDVLTTRWTPYQRPQGLARFPSVMRFIRPLLTSTNAGAPIIRG